MASRIGPTTRRTAISSLRIAKIRAWTSVSPARTASSTSTTRSPMASRAGKKVSTSSSRATYSR